MKVQKLLLVACVLLSLKSQSQQISSQWQWLNPKPAGYTNVKVVFSDANNGFIFNDNGDLIYSNDGGAHWAFQQTFVNARAMDIRDSTGVIAGFSNVIHITTDNGLNWQKKIIATGENPYFPFVQVVSRDTLLALNSNNSTLYRSTDRGNTWTKILTNSVLNNNLCFHFVNSNVGFIGGYNRILKTIDGGTSWQTIYGGTRGFLSICFFDMNFGFASDETGRIIKTTDGGLTWNVNTIHYDIKSFHIVDANTVYAVGEQAKIYKSINGGNTWTAVSPAAPYAVSTFNSVYFFNESKGLAVGSDGKILSTSNGGQNWNQYANTHVNIQSFRIPDSKVMYAIDHLGVHKSLNAGQTWQFANPTAVDDHRTFTHSWFRNNDTGFVIAKESARFYRTYDGGQTWQAYYPFSFVYEKAIIMDFVNDSTGYICMATPVSIYNFYKTENGGETWVQVNKPPNNDFANMDFITGGTGYIATTHKILKTGDSAQNWKVVLNEDNEFFSGLHFINDSVGYVYGSNALLRKTTDGGDTWTKINMPYSHYTGMHFFNEKVGYIATETYNQGVLKTYDGGKTWHKEFNLSPEHMISTRDTLMYIAGAGGMVLKQAIGGYNIDSVLVKRITPCTADFTANVSVAFGSVSNIRVEYGINSFSNFIGLTPSSVTDSTVRLMKVLENLQNDTRYDYRLSFLYKGSQFYSEADTFRTLALPKPDIIVKNDTLVSSGGFDYQWFLNGELISGAVERAYIVKVSGIYTVQLIQSGCLSPMSDPAIINIAAIDLERQVTVSPNPTSGDIYLGNQTGNKLIFSIKDINGRIVYTGQSNSNLITIPFKNMVKGLYLITISEAGRSVRVVRKILKQ